MEKASEVWKSPRAIEEERRQLRMKVGSSLAEVVFSGLMEPVEAKKFYNNQFPETLREDA